VLLIVVAINTAELIVKIERVSTYEHFWVYDMDWIATRNDVNKVVKILEECAAVSLEWASRPGLTFDTAKTKMALFTYRHGHKIYLQPTLRAKIREGDNLVQFNTEATSWLDICIDTHVIFKEHYNQCIKQAMAAENRPQMHTGIYGVVLVIMRAVLIACIQAVALYRCKLW
jgi:hypothetical protein